MAPGASGNPRGRPVGATGRFSEARLNDFAREWREYGPEVIATVRQRDPVAFLQIATRLVPKFLVQMERPACLVTKVGELGPGGEALKTEVEPLIVRSSKSATNHRTQLLPGTGAVVVKPPRAAPGNFERA